MSREIAGEIERIRQIYCHDVSVRQHRVVPLPGRKSDPEILHTFLGFELKVGRRRISCPDLSTARYLSLFAELGFKEVRVPYDPTRTELVVPGLQGALEKIKKLVAASAEEETDRNSRLRQLYRKIRRKCQCPPAPQMS